MAFRQTNVIWVAFVAIQSLAPLLIHNIHARMLEGHREKGPPQFSLTTVGQLQELLEGLYYLLLEPRRLLALARDALSIAGGYVTVGLVFAAFLVVNGGIVVGDRSAHVAVFHPTQVLYFAGFTLGMSAPYFVTLTKVRRFVTFSRRHYLFMGVSAILCYCVVDSFTYAHPYLLADNRHYTFYIWRKVIDRAFWTRYVLLPAYIYGGFCLLYHLRRCGIMFKAFYPIFVILNLSPQLLMEFRYFIIPFLLYRLQVRALSWPKLIAEFLLFSAINAATIYLYVKKPFRWEHEPEEIQRFMW